MRLTELDFADSEDFRTKWGLSWATTSLPQAPLFQIHHAEVSSDDEQTAEDDEDAEWQGDSEQLYIVGRGFTEHAAKTGGQGTAVSIAYTDIVAPRGGTPKMEFNCNMPSRGFVNLITRHPPTAVLIGRMAVTGGLPRRGPILGHNVNGRALATLELLIEQTDITVYDLPQADQVAMHWDMFYRTYYPFEAAISLLQSGERVACAINERIALALSATRSGAVLYWYGTIVGVVNLNTKEVTLATNYERVRPLIMEYCYGSYAA